MEALKYKLIDSEELNELKKTYNVEAGQVYPLDCGLPLICGEYSDFNVRYMSSKYTNCIIGIYENYKKVGIVDYTEKLFNRLDYIIISSTEDAVNLRNLLETFLNKDWFSSLYDLKVIDYYSKKDDWLFFSTNSKGLFIKGKDYTENSLTLYEFINKIKLKINENRANS